MTVLNFAKPISQLARMTVLGLALIVLTSTGCRQSVSNQNNGRLLPSLFGRSSPQDYQAQPSYSGTSAWGQGSAFPSFSQRTANAGSNGRTSPFFQTSSATSHGSGIPGNSGAPNAYQADLLRQQYSQELAGYNKQLSAYDSDNQLLNTEIAALEQKLQLANQYSQTLRDQLADTSQRVQQSDRQRQAAIDQLAAAQQQIQTAGIRVAEAERARTQALNQQQSVAQQIGFRENTAPTRLAGATLRGNNSLLEHFTAIQIPGGEARMDGDVIRVEIPSDNLFVPGTYEIQPAQQPLLQNLATTIRQRFPQQIVGIEAHWDNTPLTPSTTTDHQLTATQALAMFDFFVRLGLPRNQLFTMAMASNRPRHRPGLTNGISPNRRIEFVIYPETYDGR